MGPIIRKYTSFDEMKTNIDTGRVDPCRSGWMQLRQST